MTDEQALLKAIAEQPDEDTPRLAFADWLDESGGASNHARAEFIRVQVELATATDPERIRNLRRREAEAWQPHRYAWRAAIPAVPGINWRGYDRGFLTAIDADQMQDFVAHADTLFAAAPVQSVRILRARPRVTSALANLPRLDWLRSLDLTDCEVLTDEDVDLLASSPGVKNLRVLRLGRNWLTARTPFVLARSGNLRNLRRLDLGLAPTAAGADRILEDLRAAFPNAEVS